MKSLLIVFVSVLVVGVAYAHPPVTFTTLLNAPNPNTTAGVPYNLTFYIFDMFNNFDKVNITQLIPMHSRYVHVMLASNDLEMAFHLHPDDYSPYSEMAKRDSYFVTLTFPKAGRWYMALSFMANISGTLREGAAQIEFVVPGSPGPNTPVFDYKNAGMFRTYSISSNDIFSQVIDIRTNTVTSGGYTVIMNTTANNMKTIPSYTCQTFNISIFDPNGNPVTSFVPFLDAPFHAIYAADDDTVYHGHGMDLPSIAPNLQRIVYYAKMMDMMFNEMNGGGGMHMDMTDEEEYVIMNAMMLGMDNTGVINCTKDLGPTYQKYKIDPYMPMLPTTNYTFGPNFLSVFDFPNVGNWRVFFYFKIQTGNETRLIVPHFSFSTATSPNTPTLSPPLTSAKPTTSSTSHLTPLFALLLVALWCAC